MYANLFFKDRNLDSNTCNRIPIKPLKSHHIGIFKTAFAQPLI